MSGIGVLARQGRRGLMRPPALSRVHSRSMCAPPKAENGTLAAADLP